MAKKFNAFNYQSDKLYPSVARCMSEILATTSVVTPVDVLLRMKRITKQQYEDWRFGRVPYLERVCNGNLSTLNRVLRILALHARTLGLTPSQTAYHRWGKRGKGIALRFSKSGDPMLEAAYSRHYVAKPRSDPKGSTAALVPEQESTTTIPIDEG